MRLAHSTPDRYLLPACLHSFPGCPERNRLDRPLFDDKGLAGAVRYSGALY